MSADFKTSSEKLLVAVSFSLFKITKANVKQERLDGPITTVIELRSLPMRSAWRDSLVPLEP